AAGAADDAGQQLDQRRLAGAVLADDGVNFVVVERKGRRLERQHRPVVLFEIAQLENGPVMSPVALRSRFAARRDIRNGHWFASAPEDNADTGAAPCQMRQGATSSRGLLAVELRID